MTRERRHDENRANAAQHGTRSRYNGGCRCGQCVDANRRYAAEWRTKSRELGYRFVKGHRIPRPAGDTNGETK